MRVVLFRDETPLGHRVVEYFRLRSSALSLILPEDLADGYPANNTRYVSGAQDLLELAEYVHAFQADYLVVATFPWKLPAELVRAAPVAFNLHSALLPELRGAHPEFWAIRRGMSATGLTAHALSDRFDAGEIFHQVRVPIGPEETLGSLSTRFADVAVHLLEDLLSRPQPWPSTSQQGEPTRAPLVTDADLRLRPEETAESILRHARACAPYLTPWIDAEGRRIAVSHLRDLALPSPRPPGVWREGAHWLLSAGDAKLLAVHPAGGQVDG
jgi:methionyl-tRNA formyltransferase